jgi:hypothetical protein
VGVGVVGVFFSGNFLGTKFEWGKLLILLSVKHTCEKMAQLVFTNSLCFQ